MKKELQSRIPNGVEKLFLSTQEQKQDELQEELHKLEERRSTIRRAISIRERKIRDWKGKIPRESAIPENQSMRALLGESKTSKSTIIGEVSQNDASVISILPSYGNALAGLTDFGKAWLFLAPIDGKNVSMKLVDIVSWDRKQLLLKIRKSSELLGRKIVDIKPYLPYCEAHEK